MRIAVIQRSRSGWEVQELEVLRTAGGQIECVVTDSCTRKSNSFAWSAAMDADVEVAVSERPMMRSGLKWIAICRCGDVLGRGNTNKESAIERAVCHIEACHEGVAA